MELDLPSIKTKYSKSWNLKMNPPPTPLINIKVKKIGKYLEPYFEGMKGFSVCFLLRCGTHAVSLPHSGQTDNQRKIQKAFRVLVSLQDLRFSDFFLIL